MKIEAVLELDVVAVEADDELSVLVHLTAPPMPPAEQPHPPSTLVVVLDRSGSMAGDRLEGAKRALLSLVDRLAPGDRFGLVTFDDTVRVDVPAAPLHDKAAVEQRVAGIASGNMTDLSSGYLRGLQEARRVAGDESTTVLLISDGHANVGSTDPDRLASVAATYATQRVSTSALGYGLGYDERLLAAVAKGGRGNELFAEDPDQAGALIAGEVDGLLSQTVQAASLLVRMSPHVRAVQLVNDSPATLTADGLLIELGGFWADEERKLLLTFAVPGLPSVGLVQIAGLELTYADAALSAEQTVALPLHVNVVPGDEAAGRIANPVVVTERAFQTAQRAKREASEQLSAGDAAGAAHGLSTARDDILAAMAVAPAPAQHELVEEASVVDAMLAEAQHGTSSRAAKFLSSDAARKSRLRGRGPGADRR